MPDDDLVLRLTWQGKKILWNVLHQHKWQKRSNLYIYIYESFNIG